MFINISDSAERVETLQKMLRYISFAKNEEGLRADVTGVYSAGAENAVRNYQASRGLEVTGVTDLETWNAIRDEYEREKALREPVLIKAIPAEADYETGEYERGDTVMILQIILNALRYNYGYPELAISGVYSPQSAEAIRIFQVSNGLSPTGIADRKTWQLLSDEYNLLYLD